MASMKSMFENQVQKLEEDLEAAKKENSELQTKVCNSSSNQKIWDWFKSCPDDKRFDWLYGV